MSSEHGMKLFSLICEKISRKEPLTKFVIALQIGYTAKMANAKISTNSKTDRNWAKHLHKLPSVACYPSKFLLENETPDVKTVFNQTTTLGAALENSQAYNVNSLVELSAAAVSKQGKQGTFLSNHYQTFYIPKLPNVPLNVKLKTLFRSVKRNDNSGETTTTQESSVQSATSSATNARR